MADMNRIVKGIGDALQGFSGNEIELDVKFIEVIIELIASIEDMTEAVDYNTDAVAELIDTINENKKGTKKQ